MSSTANGHAGELPRIAAEAEALWNCARFFFEDPFR
jgi:hypothetical protein